MVRRIVATACAFLVLSGCTRPQSSSPPDLGGPSGTITWIASVHEDKPLLGIDQASIYHEGTALVVWSDFDGGGGGSSSGNVQGVQGHGSLRSQENRVDVHFKTKDGKTGPVTINEEQYDLANGGLFLVSASDGQVRVKQLKRDMRNVKFDKKSLQSFAKGDPEIVAFFADDAKN